MNAILLIVLSECIALRCVACSSRRRASRVGHTDPRSNRGVPRGRNDRSEGAHAGAALCALFRAGRGLRHRRRVAVADWRRAAAGGRSSGRRPVERHGAIAALAAAAAGAGARRGPRVGAQPESEPPRRRRARGEHRSGPELSQRVRTARRPHAHRSGRRSSRRSAALFTLHSSLDSLECPTIDFVIRIISHKSQVCIAQENQRQRSLQQSLK